MKKSLILVSIMFAATTLFAETITCESKMGECVYEINLNGNYSESCICRNGEGRGEGGSYGMPTTLPTEEECLANLEKHCKDAGFKCENEAGECIIEQYNEYICRCKGVWSANGAVEGGYTGTVEFVEESCKSKLVEICGTELATIRDVCEDQEILNECVSYIKPVETCYGRWSNEYIEGIEDIEFEDILNLPAYGNHISFAISNCCQWGEDDDIKEWRTKWECLENCTEEDCCKACGLFYTEDEQSEESVADAANTEAQATDATPEDKSDGDSAAPAENKEESKSDGCSTLFI